MAVTKDTIALANVVQRSRIIGALATMAMVNRGFRRGVRPQRQPPHPISVFIAEQQQLTAPVDDGIGVYYSASSLGNPIVYSGQSVLQIAASDMQQATYSCTCSNGYAVPEQVTVEASYNNQSVVNFAVAITPNQFGNCNVVMSFKLPDGRNGTVFEQNFSVTEFSSVPFYPGFSSPTQLPPEYALSFSNQIFPNNVSDSGYSVPEYISNPVTTSSAASYGGTTGYNWTLNAPAGSNPVYNALSVYKYNAVVFSLLTGFAALADYGLLRLQVQISAQFLGFPLSISGNTYQNPNMPIPIIPGVSGGPTNSFLE